MDKLKKYGFLRLDLASNGILVSGCPQNSSSRFPHTTPLNASQRCSKQKQKISVVPVETQGRTLLILSLVTGLSLSVNATAIYQLSEMLQSAGSAKAGLCTLPLATVLFLNCFHLCLVASSSGNFPRHEFPLLQRPRYL